ncbi:hypothetical protein [Telluribacter sp. SYSU D00476]|uniref:hypothetical protein n=1 Tax=Telluribacter sp. SYSU D00476 TaxID=2811430 RepID=UPI001FF34E4D|nr:hypothetical protein [Telluribacter sp. SYSU D00476]
MKVISPRFHAILDYLLVVSLWAVAGMYDWDSSLSAFTFVLGGIHLILTLVTRFPGGMFKLVPFPIHGYIELIVGVLALLASLFYFEESLAKNFYLGFGIVVLVVWALTNYRSSD